MPGMPHMSPAAIGCKVVRLRGLPDVIEALADGREHRIGAAEAGGRRHRDDGAVRDEFGRLGGGENPGH